MCKQPARWIDPWENQKSLKTDRLSRGEKSFVRKRKLDNCSETNLSRDSFWIWVLFVVAHNRDGTAVWAQYTIYLTSSGVFAWFLLLSMQTLDVYLCGCRFSLVVYLSVVVWVLNRLSNQFHRWTCLLRSFKVNIMQNKYYLSDLMTENLLVWATGNVIESSTAMAIWSLM